MVRHRLASFRFRAEGGCGDFAGDTIGGVRHPQSLGEPRWRPVTYGSSLYRTERECGWRPPLARRSREPPAKRALTIGRLDR
jgi:hypothetical protein